jgi:hypothetical protein
LEVCDGAHWAFVIKKVKGPALRFAIGRATRQSTQFLDYQVVNADIEAERDHLRVRTIRIEPE